MDKDLTVAVLAGGASRRMGSDKSFVLLDGRPLIQHVLERLAPLSCPIMMITNDPERYERFRVPMFSDLVRQRGSLGGLYTALSLSKSDAVLCVACDMPFLNPTLLSYLGALLDSHDAAVPVVDGHYQTLHAVYRKSCLPHMARALQMNRLRISDCLRDAAVRWVDECELRQFDPDLQSFMNVNTPANLQQAELNPGKSAFRSIF
jgi:molybdopterin-guanine dinucleotide biosynthesis protein A